jgi:hypothetical protein
MRPVACGEDLSAGQKSAPESKIMALTFRRPPICLRPAFATRASSVSKDVDRLNAFEETLIGS